MSQLRSTILAQTERLASKSRFGMFSVPPPLAVGDDSPFKQIQHPRGQDGKPVTKPRNLLGGTNRSGMGKKGYFGVPDSIYQGDKYVDSSKIEIDYDKKMHTRSSMHQTEFKPSSAYKTLAKSSYEYIEEKQGQQRRRKLDQNGRVWTQPKNITTNQTNRVERQFMKNPEYISDPYDRKKEQETQQKKIWKSKLPQANWKFVASSNPTFNKDKITYGLDEDAKKVLSQKKEPRTIALKTVAHEASFVPVKKVGGYAIGKYPSAMSAQSMQTLRTRSMTENKEKEKWKPNNGLTKSKPTPSISLNRKNICIGRYK